jgi:hypothetical protein
MTDADKQTDAGNVVRFGNLAKPPQAQGADVNRERASIDATRAVARLSLLGRLEYERARSKAAKELGCRVSFLDRVIASIHEAVGNFQRDYTLCSFARGEGEKLVYLRRLTKEEADTPSGRLAGAKDVKTGQQTDLLLLADGDFTIVRGGPSLRQFR